MGVWREQSRRKYYSSLTNSDKKLESDCEKKEERNYDQKKFQYIKAHEESKS